MLIIVYVVINSLDMSSKDCFNNTLKDFSSNIVHTYLNESTNKLNDDFYQKLKYFKTTKLKKMTSDLRKEIFYDSTIYTGSAGLALYYFNCASLGCPMSKDYLLMSLKYIDLDKLKKRKISFICGAAGPLAMATVIVYKLGDNRPENYPDHKTIVQRLLTLSSNMDDSPDEILYGKAGYLYALLFVNKYIKDPELIPSSHIEKVIAAILLSGQTFSKHVKSESPLLWHWHDKIYFGAAHGMAGILYLLLQARSYTNTKELYDVLKPTLDWLLSQRYPSGNFPSSLGSRSNDRLVQWCHGAPGFVSLCILAYQVFKEETYLKIALQCGEVVWKRGLCVKGYSLCHGVSGNAYTFLQLYQATKEPIHLYRACVFTEWCLSEQPGTELHCPDRPASLFEGLVGRLYLAEDMCNISEAKFPAFCL